MIRGVVSRMGLAVTTMVIAVAISVRPLAAQDCGNNQTKFLVAAAPSLPQIAAPTAADYVAGESQWSQTVTLQSCCGNQGGGNNCRTTIALGAVGSPNLANVSWRLVSISGSRCTPAVPAITVGQENVLTGTAVEVHRMNNPTNGGTICFATIEFRGTGLGLTTHLAGNTYSRTISFAINKF